ncbi:hypothetical protein FO440_06355 [Mucilaginibacter corticis]|uniref:Uncharacterized protein n=1 Tax=Mucilaginibacter corticis TaxID=2597670 RepID=A0A556MV45_9SPHI|nr:hypothetical protein [Mucilaginibacter corticis]TSJ43806.1 hypothetical protein FO440_06355 [Mucilaginibacter corticis]
MTRSSYLSAALFICLFQLTILKKSVAANLKPGHPKIDFFKDPQYLKGGYEEIHSFDLSYKSGPLPGLRYVKPGAGLAYIICYPNNLKDWTAQVKAIKDRKLRYEAQENEVSKQVIKIAQEPALQRQYRIFAFFIPADHVVETNTKQRKITMPKFPCNISVYKKTAAGWTFIKEAKIKELRDYAYLLYKTIDPPQSLKP